MTVARSPSLTPRQEQILALISEGMTNREIGARLGVTEKTIKNSVTGLLASLNLQRRSQAAVYEALRQAAQQPGTAPRAGSAPSSAAVPSSANRAARP